MYYSYYFCEQQSAELEQALKELNIHYDISDFSSLVPTLLSFTVRGDSTELSAVLALSKRTPVVTVVYTRSELENTELLWLWPKKQRIDILNTSEAFSASCLYGIKVKHLKQVSTLTIAKEPSDKGNCAFWSEDTGHSVLFTDRRIREICESNDLRGFLFQDVLLRRGIISNKIFQLSADTVLPLEAVATGHGELTRRCPFCGKVQLEHDNKYQLHLKSNIVDPRNDFYMTDDFWGPGIGRPLYIISQRFYQHLINNKLTAGITLSPVSFV